MIKILLVEDEKPAAKRLAKIITEHCPQSQILAIIDSVEETVEWLNTNKNPDLIFMDIQLADGLSFSIFKKIKVDAPIIFTTAYDQYAIKAFKVNSIDYLLKPIDIEELKNAWQKFLNLRSKHQKDSQSNSQNELVHLLANFQQQLQNPKFKERFLVKLGEQYKYILTQNIAYFKSEQGLSYLATKENKMVIVDEKMDDIENLLNPTIFYRINRKYIVHIEAIHKIKSYTNSRLKLTLQPNVSDDIIVARERVHAFKEWLDS